MWLLRNTGPVIRHRAIVDLLGETNEKAIESSKNDLLSCELVKQWLVRLPCGFEGNAVHGGRTESYENVMGKLYEFGLRRGFETFDRRTEPARRWLGNEINRPSEQAFSVFYRTMVAAFLSMTGYAGDEAVNAWLMKRLDTVYPFAKRGKLDIYAPQHTFPAPPKQYRRHQLIDPAIYPQGEMKLPWIHDVNAFLHSATMMEDKRLRSKVETVMEFVLTPEYQKLPPGYGVIRCPSGKYYMMGWSVHLPGYFGSAGEHCDFGRLLLWMSIAKRSRTVREHQWFRRSLSLLEGYTGEDGLTLFPREFMPEKRFGYWVWGRRMALESAPRTGKAIKCESTFRLLEIAG